MKQLIIILMMLVGFSTSSMAQSFEHVVKIGEDFASIAQKYGIPEEELKEANPKSKICYVGLKLIVPRSAVKKAEPQQAKNASKDEKADKKGKQEKEKVEKQDKKEKSEKAEEKQDEPKKSRKMQRTRTRKSKS